MNEEGLPGASGVAGEDECAVGTRGVGGEVIRESAKYYTFRARRDRHDWSS